MQPSDPNYWNPGEESEESPVQAPSPTQAAPAVVPETPGTISWEASEYLQHDNGLWWYVGFFVVAAVLIVFSILLHDWIFIPVVLVMAVAGLMHVRRPPRVLHYRLDDDGLRIDDTLHPYMAYKSFSVIRDGAFYALLLIPARRFAASTIIYFDEADGEAIVDAFGTRLPMENRGLDSLDRFLRLIRF